jgi:glyoxylase-like metal-dependent hydrolase (beta-lactamase superfamily II)
MINIKAFVFNPFQENTYILSDETGECAIVDPGCNTEKEFSELLNYISSNQFKAVKLINTHGHIDHVLGLSRVSEHFQLKPEINKVELYLTDNFVSQGKMFGFNAEPIPNFTNFLEEGTPVIFGNSRLEVLLVPGHTLGSVAFFNILDKFVITGDVLFKGSIGRTDLPGGDYNVLMESINNKLLNLGDDVKIFPGHGPSSTIGEEKRSNPFLH